MMMRDVMPAFALYQPKTLADAAALAGRHGRDAWLLAGGNDSLSWFKDRIKRPKVVIDLAGIAELRGVRETADGLEIGAMTTLAEIERHPVIRGRYRLLADAAGKTAHPQIRASGTIGGNVSQDTRCWYYRYGLPCYRAGGNTCFSDTPEGQNREHALFLTRRCVAVSPSDTAPATVALDATMVIRNGETERTLAASDFFVGPEADITRMTALGPGDILTAIRLPKTFAGAKFHFEKIMDRGVDFPLVNVAAALKLGSAGTISDARIVVNAVAAVPYRVRAAEEALRGRPISADIARIAGQVSTHGAKPLNDNGYKIPLMQNLVMRAVRDAA
ncbi:MAG TPA: xanthine dehydrogenase family protein subunit M [Hyphomicrobiales bacterium]|nr:xanthine dehydrogenase family protein subunit M [Hyphomicrobiales bacterium]